MNSVPSNFHDPAVVIVGGGPTGLVLAIELASLGIACVVFEQNADTTSFPKASANGARTLEHYRRLGMVDDIRRIGFPHETAYFTRLTQHELVRFRLAGMQSLTRRDAGDLAYAGVAAAYAANTRGENAARKSVPVATGYPALWLAGGQCGGSRRLGRD